MYIVEYDSCLTVTKRIPPPPLSHMWRVFREETCVIGVAGPPPLPVRLPLACISFGVARMSWANRLEMMCFP